MGRADPAGALDGAYRGRGVARLDDLDSRVGAELPVFGNITNAHTKG